jgi:hypothetical protein
MKTVKLTKKLLKLYPSDLLVALGAVDKEKKRVFPSEVYFSKEDLKKWSENVYRLAQKERPGFTKKYVKGIVAMENLNYGPNESLKDAIRPGFALVDFDAIQKETNESPVT